MAESNMEDMPDFLSMHTDLSLEDYFAASNYGNSIGSAVADEPWKELSDGSDSGIDSEYRNQFAFLHSSLSKAAVSVLMLSIHVSMCAKTWWLQVLRSS